MTQDYDKEYWHANETRSIPWPGGGRKEFTLERIYWGCYDALIGEHGMAPVTVAKICIEWAMSGGTPVDDAFGNILAHMDHELNEIIRPLREFQAEKAARPTGGPIVFKDALAQIDSDIARLEAMRTIPKE